MDHLQSLGHCQALFLETAQRADLRTPVPWLGRWRVEQLVVHLARIHHWAAGQARRRQEEPLGRGPFDVPQLYADCAAELRETLASLDPEARAWALVDDGVPKAEQRGTVRFWHRRQLHETLIHLWDLRTAIGEPLEDAELGDAAALWFDCIDEVVAVMHPRQLRLERVPPPPVRIAFAATGADAVLELAGASADAPSAVVRGPARSLALLAWGRGVPDHDRLAAPGVEVQGERSLAEAALRAGLTP
ncbi:maleylpyruvate isomerase family mycothiol-dependent enzyme [Agrococcus sp. Marseille-P2731]|uniref:maleylpyruvate isomerase family mycothiol-dependent enzyme n=1 Tax=Agrococcus sp. Marseille-P2731 TaxID=1841862 RepID=UPI000930C6A6|nr:maleylpyruvate isomerase family mycothiol-dependent enzyme [Agrococcus sp. Marseille-P2731]